MLAFLPKAAAQQGEQIQSTRIQRGELSVIFRDNSQSPRELSGIDALFNVKHAAGFDAYDPDTRGASAGLNFEHIICGHANPNNKFTPRHGRYTLRKLPDGNSALLRRQAEDSPWKVASTLKYVVNEPHYIEFSFRCTPQDASLFGRRGYAEFFFANYMNDVQDVSLHFRGHQSPEACLNEYERWAATLDAEKARVRAERVQQLKVLGATVFTRGDDIVELLANRTKITDKDLALVSEFAQLTDLSLEETAIGDAGLVHLRNLQKLEWLNLYRSRIGDPALMEVSRLKSLQHLPIGETHVTDAGLAHLSDMKQLVYLGLRGNNVTNAGVKHVGELVSLTGLHLGETKVTDAGLTPLLSLTSLEKLWLDETMVSDEAIATLARLKSLRELHIAGTKITSEGVKRLSALLPRCQIVDGTR
jgi:hypothetical protein